MKHCKRIAAVIAAITLSAALGGCASAGEKGADVRGEEYVEEQLIPSIELPPEEVPGVTASEPPEEEPAVEGQPEVVAPEPLPEPVAKPPEVTSVNYISVTAVNVNIRSGAGTNYSAVGTAEKSTLYACLGEVNGWYKTEYRGKTAYVSKKYCDKVPIEKSDNKLTEEVIAEGVKLLGTPYVYGAVRLHDGKGNKLKSFTAEEFDCSSLMQYVFYKGANVLLQVNTRTQIYQGTTVSKSKLKRGDLMFFTNASRKNNTGIERVGHVALYLGDNYILHTASDYAKIEKINSTRWGYFIQAQRIL